MKKLFFYLIISNLFLISCTNNSESTIVDLMSKSFKIGINDKGSIIDFIDLETNKNYLSNDTSTFLMSLRIDNEIKIPQSATVKNGQVSDIP